MRERVMGGRSQSGVTVVSSGQTLSDSAQADATTVYAGGEQRVTGARAVASSTRIAGPGVQLVTGGSAVSATIGAGGVQDVTSFGSAEATTLERGGLLMDGLNDAIVSNVTFLQGGTLDFPTLALSPARRRA
jgi:autotransporter passenger strand-loop-strand repeat protein